MSSNGATEGKPDLWTVMLLYRGTTVTQTLNFVGESGAKLAYQKIQAARRQAEGSATDWHGQPLVEVADHFGITVEIAASDLSAVQLGHVEEMSEANIASSLANAHMQAKFQTKARSDATLRFAAASFQGANGAGLVRAQ